MPSVDNLQQNSNQLYQKYQPPSHVPTTFTWTQWGGSFKIAGSFDDPYPSWSPIDMNKDEINNVGSVTLNLIPNKKYFYKFVIDGQWVLDPSISSYPDESGNNYNHVIEVEPPPPPPLPSKEEETVEDQKEDKVENLEFEAEPPLSPPLPSKEENMSVEEERIENLEYEVEPTPLPSEEEKLSIEGQKEEKVDNLEPEAPLPSEEEKVPIENQKEEEIMTVEEDQKEEMMTVEDQKEEMTVEDQKEESMTVEDQKEEMTVEDQKEEMMTVEDQKEEEMTVEDQKEEMTTVEDQKEEGMTVEDQKEEEMTVEDQKEEEMTVEDQKEEEMTVEDLKEENKVENLESEVEPPLPSEEMIGRDQKENESEVEPPSEKEEPVEDQKEEEVECLESKVEPPLPSEEVMIVKENESEVEPPSEKEEPVEDQKEEEVECLESKVEPPLPSEEETVVRDQKEDNECVVVPTLQPSLPSEKEEMTVEGQKDEEKVERLESEVHQKEHYHENQIVNENQELRQNVEEQVKAGIQKEQYQHEEQVLSEVQTEENLHEKNHVKEHYQHYDDDQITTTADDQKERHLHDDVHQHEVSENHEKTEQVVDEVHSESTFTTGIKEITESSTESSEAVQTEESCDNPVVIEESLTLSIVEETIIESDNEKLSAENVANNESMMEETHDIVIDEETPKEPQYTSSSSHDDSMNSINSVTIIEEIKITEDGANTTNEVNSEQTKEEMSFSNQDEGISLIATINLPEISEFVKIHEGITTAESEISSVNDEGLSKLSNEAKVHEENNTEQSVVDDNSINEFTGQSVIVDSISESKVTEFIEDKSPSTDEKHEQNITTNDILTPSSVIISDSTTETHSTETIMPPSDMNYEDNYEPELENEDDNYEDDDYENDYEDDDYENDYEDDDDYKKDDNDDNVNNNEYLSYEDIFKEGTYPEGVSPEAIKEVLLNHTWAKDESIEETIPSTWLEVQESTAYKWSESTQGDGWLIQEEVTSAWISREENAGTPKSEHVIEGTHSSNEEIKSHEILSTSHVKETVTEQASVQYEKPESSATADESTTVNDQDMNNADVVKEKPKIEKQENFEESLGVNIPAGKISQRKISSISPSASSPGESTRNADMYTHNTNVATNTSREIVSQTKESCKKSKSKKPIEITSRDVLQRDPKFVKQHDNLDKLDIGIIYLITSVATTFTLGIISMLYKSVLGPKRNK